MADDFTLVVKKYEPTDPRLGRHVVHDSRSRRFAAPARDPRKLASVRHEIGVPILDQGYEGSCTGHAGTANLGGPEFWRAAREAIGADDPHQYARRLYMRATELDPWPGVFEPDDTGSDGLSVAKALKERGLISGYLSAFSLNATLTALAERPVMIGSSWRSNMFEPASDGRLSIDGGVEGGHEYLLDELDVQQQRVWVRNSWGPQWGLAGRAYLTWADLGTLLADSGDCVVLVPLSEPAPTPAPAPPSPPAPTPAPTPAPDVPDGSVAVRMALTKFLKTRAVPAYVRKPVEPWLASFRSTSKRSPR